MSGFQKTAVASFYMGNIGWDIVAAQRAVLQALAPPEMAVLQILIGQRHDDALDAFMALTGYDTVIILDVDCIPVRRGALEALAGDAAKGMLVGAAQRANHIANNGHLYVGPFCMGLSRSVWTRAGMPSFRSTERGDVGEELTYRCQEMGIPVGVMWPSSVESPLWPLTEDRVFGHGTEYAASFWHCFQIRFPQNRERFLNRCQRVFDEIGEGNQHQAT